MQFGLHFTVKSQPVTSIRDLFHNHALEIKLGLPFSVEHMILHSVASPMSVSVMYVRSVSTVHSHGIQNTEL